MNQFRNNASPLRTATYTRTLGLIPELTQRIHGDAAS
jgi:hypothetical protein